MADKKIGEGIPDFDVEGKRSPADQRARAGITMAVAKHAAERGNLPKAARLENIALRYAKSADDKVAAARKAEKTESGDS